MIYLVKEDKIIHLLSYAFLMFTATFNFTKISFFPKYNQVLWAFGVIFWFSIIFPFLVVAYSKISIVWIFICSVLVSFIVRVIGVHYSFFDIGNPYVNVLKDSLLGRLDDFVLGMLICYLYYESGEKINKFISPQFYFFISIVFIGISCLFYDYVRLGILPKLFLPVINNVLHVGFLFLILSLLYMKDGLIKSLFNNKPIQLIGMVSYSLFIWHWMAISPVIGKNFDLPHLAIYLALVFMISLLTYRYIESGETSSTRTLFLIK